ncbi:MAG: protein kinase [Gemmatimonadales bacterium]|nr:protein kinase [Gemmatimonadales bacterium]NIQ99405.1 protein kinase [Gemmatimonadales bacterium]NIS64073.1 protein kinase [Gemmatimonadales bacterium]
MTEQDHLFVTKGPSPSPPAAERVRTTGLPRSLLLQAVKRLRIVSGVVFVLEVVTWFGSNLVQGELALEFIHAYQWGPPVLIMAASLAVFGLTGTARVPPAALLNIGLIYEVVVSLGIAVSTYWSAFVGVTADQVGGDLIGVSAVAIWIILFATLVPAPPRRALAAMVVSAAAPPLTVLLETQSGRAPVIAADTFFWVFVFPYVLTVIVAYIAARVVYRLGQDVRRAREMGAYRLESLIGRGGMGEVWRASHRLLVRPAAVKLIRGDALGVGAGLHEAVMARFEREAQVTACLQSPHTVELYDFGTSEDGAFYYVMELLDGVDLESLVKKYGPVAAERAVHVLTQVCHSLGEAHQRGLVHRDVKPANIFLCQHAFEYDFAKVLDFGLVKHHPSAEGSEQLGVSTTGVIAGTPSYIAPEMIHGENNVDGRADIYAVGCVAYWMLTGHTVFEEPTAAAMIVAHASKHPVRPSLRSELDIPPALDDLVLACLEKEPAGRPQTAEVLARRLSAVELREPWTAERAARWWEAHGIQFAPQATCDFCD